MIITRELIKKWGHWLNDAQIAVFIPATGLTPLQLIDSDLNEQAILLILLRKEVVQPNELKLLTCRWVQRALNYERAALREPDPRSWHALKVTESFANNTATLKDLSSAARGALAAANFYGPLCPVYTPFTEPLNARIYSAFAAYNVAKVASYASYEVSRLCAERAYEAAAGYKKARDNEFYLQILETREVLEKQ